MAGPEGIGQRGLIHDSSTRHIEHERAGLRGLELGDADESAGLRHQRRVDGDDVGSMEQLGEPDQARMYL